MPLELLLELLLQWRWQRRRSAVTWCEGCGGSVAGLAEWAVLAMAAAAAAEATGGGSAGGGDEHGELLEMLKC